MPIVLENKISPIVLYGSDASDTPRDLNIKIIKIPSKGKLYDKNTISKSIIQNNVVLPLQILKKNYSTGISAFYEGHEHYFTSPSTMFNGTLLNPTLIETDSFIFCTIASDGSSSIPVKQVITVKNFNDPTIIDISNLKSSSSNVSK